MCMRACVCVCVCVCINVIMQLTMSSFTYTNCVCLFVCMCVSVCACVCVCVICRMINGVSAVLDGQTAHYTYCMPTSVPKVTVAALWKLFPIATDAARCIRQETAVHSVRATEQVCAV